MRHDTTHTDSFTPLLPMIPPDVASSPPEAQSRCERRYEADAEERLSPDGIPAPCNAKGDIRQTRKHCNDGRDRGKKAGAVLHMAQRGLMHVSEAKLPFPPSGCYATTAEPCAGGGHVVWTRGKGLDNQSAQGEVVSYTA